MTCLSPMIRTDGTPLGLAQLVARVSVRGRGSQRPIVSTFSSSDGVYEKRAPFVTFFRLSSLSLGPWDYRPKRYIRQRFYRSQRIGTVVGLSGAPSGQTALNGLLFEISRAKDPAGDHGANHARDTTRNHQTTLRARAPAVVGKAPH